MTNRERLLSGTIPSRFLFSFPDLQKITRVVIGQISTGKSGLHPCGRTDGYTLWLDADVLKTANTQVVGEILCHEARHVWQIRRYPWPLSIIIQYWGYDAREEDAAKYSDQIQCTKPIPWWVTEPHWLDEEE